MSKNYKEHNKLIKGINEFKDLQIRCTCIFQDGLIIIDVYNKWSGPCLAMSSVIKKIRVQCQVLFSIFINPLPVGGRGGGGQTDDTS